MSSHSVERHLSLRIEDYDREIRRLVPHYDEMCDEGLRVLRGLVGADATVLDLGCGTGRMSAAMLRELPNVSVIALDADEAALGQARLRLASAGDRASFVRQSFLDTLPRCDAVVASLALHHVGALADKIALYERIFEASAPGAPFVVLDATVSEDPVLREATFARWSASMGEHGIDAVTARKYFEDWAKEERYFSVYDELGALARAGFAAPECFWRKGALTVYGARR